MEILVTGYKGFIGSNLYKRLKKEGHNVYGYGRGGKLPDKKVDLVYHLAANPKVLDSIAYPYYALENIVLTYSVLQWMVDKKVKKIINMSTASSVPSPYRASKKTSEALLNDFCECYKMGAVSMRFFNVYGENDREDRFIKTSINRAKNDEDIEVYGKSGNFIYVDDCVDLLVKAKDNIVLSQHNIVEIYNEKLSYIDVAEKIIKLTCSKSKIKLERRLKDVINA